MDDILSYRQTSAGKAETKDSAVGLLEIMVCDTKTPVWHPSAWMKESAPYTGKQPQEEFYLSS